MSDWHHDAVCNGADDPEVFFRTDAASIDEALTICAGCPVTVLCLNDARANESGIHYRYGVWGGMTPDDRAGRTGARRRFNAAPTHCVECKEPMRPSGSKPDGRPLHGGRGRCRRCANRILRREARAQGRTA